MTELGPYIKGLNETLAERNTVLTDIDVTLKKAVALAEQTHRRQRRQSVATVINIALILGLAFVLLQVRSTQKVSRRNGDAIKAVVIENRETNRQVHDCTEPGGRCFERSAQATAAAVGSIVSQIGADMRHVVCTISPNARAVPGFCD